MGSGSFSNNSSNGQDVVDNKILPDTAPSAFAGMVEISDDGNGISGNNTPNRLNYDDNESYIPKSFASNFRAHERKTQALGSLQIVHQDPVVDKTPTKNYELASDNMLLYIYVGDSGGEDINAVGRGIDDRSRGYNKSVTHCHLLVKLILHLVFFSVVVVQALMPILVYLSQHLEQVIYLLQNLIMETVLIIGMTTVWEIIMVIVRFQSVV